MDERVLDALREVIDPETGLDIVSMGLVYGAEVDGDGVRVRLTMTSAACPMGDEIVEEAEAVLARVFHDRASVDVELVWDPPWTPERMTDEARAFFGWEGE
ncbi:MAG TPA: metal-sulfur cluster assembly factor [Quisquiliibacterium sp.]|nr:metal-sulfur cluster assembly factor [Quisquiliibacterium sp.]